jgi:hypothetical protein
MTVLLALAIFFGIFVFFILAWRYQRISMLVLPIIILSAMFVLCYGVAERILK